VVGLVQRVTDRKFRAEARLALQRGLRARIMN